MKQKTGGEPNWGPKLFIATFVVIVIFFWWLLLYSHGVTPTE